MVSRKPTRGTSLARRHSARWLRELPAGLERIELCFLLRQLSKQPVHRADFDDDTGEIVFYQNLGRPVSRCTKFDSG